MKHTGLFAAVGAIVVAVVLCMGSTSSAPPPEQSQIEQLGKEVASLRQRVESLERQLKGHFIIPRDFIIPKDGKESPMIIRPPGRRGPVPKDWHPFEFNGRTYYVVPIDTRQTPAQEPGK